MSDVGCGCSGAAAAVAVVAVAAAVETPYRDLVHPPHCAVGFGTDSGMHSGKHSCTDCAGTDCNTAAVPEALTAAPDSSASLQFHCCCGAVTDPADQC